MPQPSVSVRPLPLRVASVACLSAMLVFALASVTGPSPVAAATTVKAAECSANLRTKPYTTAKLRASIRAGTRVTVTKTVQAGKWRATCAGDTKSSRYWYRITQINGKSVKSLYGVDALFGARGLFKAVSFTRYTACNVKMRTSASTSATSKATVPADSQVTIATAVSGGKWKTTCAGKDVSGSDWYRIKAINGKSVSSLYGVSSVYAAAGLFKSAPSSQPPPTTTNPPTPGTQPLPGTTEGIDVSHWQNTINWPSVAAAGKKFAFIKASEDTDFVDNMYQTNRAQAKAAGLYVGAYHFAQPSTVVGNGAAQADHFLDTATPASGELFPVLDLERSNGLGTTPMITWVREYLGRIYERTGVRAIIYCSPNFWRNYMGDTTWFAQNGYEVLWIAHWTTAPAPSLPAGGWGGNGWTFWQYTSDGSVPGITGRVDLNRYNGTNLGRVLIP